MWLAIPGKGRYPFVVLDRCQYFTEHVLPAGCHHSPSAYAVHRHWTDFALPSVCVPNLGQFSLCAQLKLAALSPSSWPNNCMLRTMMTKTGNILIGKGSLSSPVPAPNLKRRKSPVLLYYTVKLLYYFFTEKEKEIRGMQGSNYHSTKLNVLRVDKDKK